MIPCTVCYRPMRKVYTWKHVASLPDTKTATHWRCEDHPKEGRLIITGEYTTMGAIEDIVIKGVIEV